MLMCSLEKGSPVLLEEKNKNRKQKGGIDEKAFSLLNQVAKNTNGTVGKVVILFGNSIYKNPLIC
jgi:hypothetical protein